MSNLPLTGKIKITCEYGKKGKLWLAGFHTGIDMVSNNDYVFSTGNGIVYRIGFDRFGYGNYVVIKIGDFYHWFCHLSKVRCNEGQLVDRESVIGIVGNTGNSTGKHLHWEIRKKCNCYGKVINPAEYAGIYNIKGLLLSRFKNGDIIKIKAIYTGSKEFNKIMVEVPKENIQTWVDESDYNYKLNTLNVVVCTRDSGKKKLLVEIKNVLQFWIDESDVID